MNEKKGAKRSELIFFIAIKFIALLAETAALSPIRREISEEIELNCMHTDCKIVFSREGAANLW